MNALRVLMHQHDRVEGLLVDLTQMGSGEGRRRALSDYTRLLRRHLEVEESQFYNQVASRLILVSADRFVQEHRQIEAMLNALEAEIDTTDFDRRLEEFHDLLVQHVSDEEIDLFPEVKRRFNVDELDAMGEQIEQMTEGVETAEPVLEESVEAPAHHDS